MKIKKVLILMTLIFTMSCGFGSAEQKLPYWLPEIKYLDGNNTCIYVDCHHGIDKYVDMSSIVVNVYDPPQYQISANMIFVDEYGNKKIIPETWLYKYNSDFDGRRMYVKYNNKWNYIPQPPYGCEADSNGVRPGGELVWWISYNIDFYGDPSRMK
jgi:hypothetical protein